MSVIDLHLHTDHSYDAQHSPQEVMELCLQAGVRVAAIADHNAISGYAAGKQRADSLGITLLPCIELDCVYNERNLHVLGYYVDPACKVFDEIEKDVYAQEKKATWERVKRLEGLGIALDHAQVRRMSNQGIASGEVLATVALHMRENENNPLLAPYRPGGARAVDACLNFYWDFCAPGKVANYPIQYISFAEALRVIHAAGGVAVLAHPGKSVGMDDALLKEILQNGAEGIEAYSSYHDAAETEFFERFAMQNGCIATCGSDFHGSAKPSVLIGAIDCKNKEYEILAAIRQVAGKGACTAFI